MTELADLNLSPSDRNLLEPFLHKLRSDLANGDFLNKQFFTVDESKLAGNTHHYWLRLGLTSDPQVAIERLIPSGITPSVTTWLGNQLERKIVRRLPPEYSTVIKIPFSVSIGEVAAEREKQIAWTITNRIPTVIPYVIYFHEINRILRVLEIQRQPPTDAEIGALLIDYSYRSIAKGRKQHREVWDEENGHLVLDSRGAQFAEKVIDELKAKNLLNDSSKFADIGSGVGTKIFAVNQFSGAHATGIELHQGIMKLARVTQRRLTRIGILDPARLHQILGDALDGDVVDLAEYDVIYVYSSLGKWEIDIDEVVDRAKSGAVILFNQLPLRNLQTVERLERIEGLSVFRKS